jgi:hypothetical protein
MARPHRDQAFHRTDGRWFPESHPKALAKLQEQIAPLRELKRRADSAVHTVYYDAVQHTREVIARNTRADAHAPCSCW